jgi:peptidoglycan/xylan/chitin deacetylase (PgdA/CDA1 family)
VSPVIPDLVRRLGRRVRRVLRTGHQGVVLLYHRVADEQSDPYGLCITPAHFEEHLQVIRAVASPLALGDVARSLRGGSLPDRFVCVTFDDGYVDNLRVAEPLLRRHDVPATVFVTTGASGRDREFWWDELERVFLQPGRLPETVEMRIGGRAWEWPLGRDAEYYSDQHERLRSWHLLDDEKPTARHAAFREAYDLLQPLSEEARTQALDGLLGSAGVDGSAVRPSRRAMEPAEVAELVSGGLVQVGAHTVSHVVLPFQSARVQRLEVAGSKRDLEEWIGEEVQGFAYPFGVYDEASVAAVHGSGFLFACSCLCEPLWRGSDPLLLPRIEVGRGDGDALSSLLRWHLRS